MITNCERCSSEVEDDDIGKCDVCEQDGLCPDCLPHDFHRKPDCGYCNDTGEVACSSTSYMACPACSKAAKE